MASREQIEKEKALILRLLGRYPKHEDLIAKAGLSKTTFYSRLNEIKEEIDIIPKDLISTIAVEQFNQLSTKMNINWEYFKEAQAEYERIRHLEYNGDDPQELINHLRAVEYAEKQLLQWQMQHSYTMKDLIHFLKAIGKYNPDILVQNIENQNSGPVINVSFPEGMQDEVSRKKLKEVNKRGGK